ncbi:MAG: sensor histidine kinase [Candidatus Hodarchaeales archaeon]
MITNNLHWLFFTEFTLHPSAPIPALKYSYGILYLFHSLITATYVIGAIIALIQVYRRSLHHLYRRQIQLLFIGVGFFFIVVILSVLQLFPISEYLDLAPLAYIVTCFFILVDIGGYHLIDIVPVANKIIISHLTKTGIIATDNNSRVIEMNAIAREYLISNERVEVIGESLFLIVDSQTHLHTYIKDKFKEIENSLSEFERDPRLSKSFEIDLIHPITLRQEYFQISIEAIQVMERLTGFMYILRNITPEKMVEAATRKSVDFKDSLLGVISHDLRNQLFVIHGFTEVIRKELTDDTGKDNNELFEFLDGIDAKVDEASIVVRNVRNYLKIMGSFDEPVKPTVINIRNIMDSVIENLIHQIEDKKIDLEINWPENAKKIDTFADLRIRSVFNNILDNAIKWSPDEGKIKVKVTEKDQFWEFLISDEGSGIPNSLKKAIFKPFVSFGPAAKIGSGLGLSITTEILQAFQGEIWVEDNKPTGAIFKFTLPIASNKS